jgi:hypothetical protein
MTDPYKLTQVEREDILESLYTALVECDECEDISQGVLDRLQAAISILGGTYDR